MKVEQSDRGFRYVYYPSYTEGNPIRLVQESSAIGNYEDSFDRPGSSFLWIGSSHHLDREEVRELVDIMQSWLKTGRLQNT